jgi:hypothetical protein
MLSKNISETALPVLSDAVLKDLKLTYEQNYLVEFGSKSSKGLYSNQDWRRVQYCVDSIPKNTNVLHMSGRFERVSGIDIRRYSKLILVDKDIDYRLMDATAMSFEDASFDTVVCMEVLEHMPQDSMVAALSELRRVSKKNLIMSVPFEEPEPLPAYHKQRFTDKELREYFPNAEIKLLKRPKNKGWPWAIMVEKF